VACRVLPGSGARRSHSMTAWGQFALILRRLRWVRFTPNYRLMRGYRRSAVRCQKPTFTGCREPLQLSPCKSQSGNDSTDLRMRAYCVGSP